MSGTILEPPRPKAPPPPLAAPRIVIFGMPDAGKTSLLGALARASEVQERIFGARLTDVSGRLTEIKREVYNDKPRHTLEESLAYQIHAEPFHEGRIDGLKPFDIIAIDCDGRQASDIVHQATKAGSTLAKGGLADELRKADALVIVVDASAESNQVEADFTEFAEFLKQYRRERGSQVEVAALPVVLAIAKCDLLAKVGDTGAVWAERIEAKKDEVADRFREFLDKADTSLFGSLDFSAHAVAIRQPVLANVPGRPKEPRGVAEMFRNTFDSARDFRKRVDRARLSMNRTLAGLVALAAVLAAFAMVIGLARGLWAPSPLASKVEAYRAREGKPPAGYLDEPLDQNINELSSIAASPEFESLNAGDRDFVTNRIDELSKFLDFKNRIRAQRPPADARDLIELKSIETDLHNPPVLPTNWNATDAGRLLERREAEISAIRAAAKHMIDSADNDKRAVDNHRLFSDRRDLSAPVSWPTWYAKTPSLLAPSATYRPADLLPNSPEGSKLAYRTPLSFPEVKQAADRLAKSRGQLESLRDIVRALGLVSEGSELKVPTTFSMDQAPALWESFQKRYRKYNTWNAADYPDAVRAELKRTAQIEYRRLMAPGQAALATAYAQAKGGVETPGKWLAALNTVGPTPAFKAWNEMEKLLLRLGGEDRPDPVAALADFLTRDEFMLDLKTIRITIPDDLAMGKLETKGPWVFSLQNVNGEVTKRNFGVDGPGLRDPRRRTTTLVFAVEGPSKINFVTGDVVWADLPVRDAAGNDLMLSWWGGGVRSRLYQFDRLVRAPRLHRKDQKIDDGELMSGVQFDSQPVGGLPRVPDLMPDVK